MRLQPDSTSLTCLAMGGVSPSLHRRAGREQEEGRAAGGTDRERRERALKKGRWGEGGSSLPSLRMNGKRKWAS